MTISIAIETPLQDDVRRLVERLNDHLLPLSPLEFQFKMTVEQMADSDTTLFVARDENGKAVGMGALKMHGPDLGEVKRMYTVPARADARNRHRGWHGRGTPALYPLRVRAARAFPRLSGQRVVGLFRTSP